DDRLPDPRIMVAHPSVDPGLLPVHGAGERPEDALSAQVFTLLGGDVLARREIVAAAEMPVAGPGQDRAAYRAILPEIDPGGRDLVRGRLIEDVRLGWIIQRDVGDAVALLIIDGHIALLGWRRSFRRPFLVAPPHRFSEAAGMVGPIALLCGQRCRFLNFLHPLAETKGFVRPVSNGSLRLSQLLLQTLSRGLGIFSLGRRRACVFSERSDRSKLSAQ